MISNELSNLAWTARGMDDNAAAHAYVAQLQEITVTTRDTFESSVTALIQGDLALATGAYQQAARHYHEVFAASWRRDDHWVAADALVGLAGVVNRRAIRSAGPVCWGPLRGLYLRLGVPFPPRDRPDYPPGWPRFERNLGERVFAQARSAGAALTPKRWRMTLDRTRHSFAVPEAFRPGRGVRP